MRLYFYGFLLLIQKFILRQNTGKVLYRFATRMGVVYIKMAQIVAMQNYGNVFTENDRIQLAKICDHCNPISYRKIAKQIEHEYGKPLSEIFQYIDPNPVGSASISQVHRAVLLDGREVAVKVKRKDIAKRVTHDTRQIRRFIHRFGKLAKFRNYLGSDKALELWAKWIEQETDFRNEQQNLQVYQEFADSVNGKLAGTITIKVPGLIPEFCTDNIIMMEFITAPTINQLELTPENKQRIRRGMNDYVQLSFYALLHGLPVTFHGDPHGGNVYLDDAGSVGFLDLGLIFSFSGEEADYTRQLFLNAYNVRTDKLVELLLQNGKYTNLDRVQYRADVEAQARRFRIIPTSQYFVEMMNLYTRYNIEPPEITYKLGKAFLALYGMNNFIENATNTKTLLGPQIVEYYLNRAHDDVTALVKSGLDFLPDFVSAISDQGIIAGLAEQIVKLDCLRDQFFTILDHGDEILSFFKPEASA